jgi:outer membrane protein
MTLVPIRSAPRATEHRAERFVAATLLALALIGGRVAEVHAQQPAAAPMVRLSLDDALRIAQMRSPTVDVARASVTRATGTRYQARSQYLPQLNGTAGYTKTLKSQFSSFAAAPAADTTPVVPKVQSLCSPFVSATASAAERAAALAQAATCPVATAAGGFDLSKTSFGATNQYAFGLNFSQNLFTAGRVAAQNQAADAGLRSANIEVTAQRAQASLDVTQAYYDAVLAEQLVAIADSSLAQTETVLAQTKVSKAVGNTSEFELLRAQVTRDNQLPVRIQAAASRDIAYLRLKQLLNMPLDDALQLTTRIEEASGPAMPTLVANATTDTVTADRAPVRQLDEAVRIQEAQVKIARAERFPSLALVSNYQRLYFPAQIVPNLSNGVNNWTVGLATNIPILDGGRIKGDQLIAHAGLEQTRAQREQTRQFAALDTRIALNALQQAQATWDASRGTAEQAQRAYGIDQVRFREGISTQTDLSQSRLLLEQAVVNRAQAARNLAVARVRLALLRDLPLQAGGAASTGAAQQQQQPQQSAQQQRSSTTPSAATGGTSGGIQP